MADEMPVIEWTVKTADILPERVSAELDDHLIAHLVSHTSVSRDVLLPLDGIAVNRSFRRYETHSPSALWLVRASLFSPGMPLYDWVPLP